MYERLLFCSYITCLLFWTVATTWAMPCWLGPWSLNNLLTNIVTVQQSDIYTVFENCGLFEILLLTQWCSLTESLAQGLWVIWELSFPSRIWVKKGGRALVCLRCFGSWSHEVSHWGQYPVPWSLCGFLKEWAPEPDTSGDFQLCHPPLWACLRAAPVTQNIIGESCEGKDLSAIKS